MNVSSILTTDYENISDWTLGENKPNSNPIQTQSKPVLPVPYQIGSCRHLVWEAQPALSVVEWVEWANFKKNECKLLCYMVL